MGELRAVMSHPTTVRQALGQMEHMEEEQLWDFLYNIPGMRKVLFVKVVFYRYPNISLKTLKLMFFSFPRQKFRKEKLKQNSAVSLS